MLYGIVMGCLMTASAISQEPFSGAPGKSGKPFGGLRDVQVIQDLNFGSFYVGNGAGKVVVHPDGTRTSSGSVILAGGPYQEAIFQITVPPNNTVYLEAKGGVLSGKSGGEMDLTIDPANHIDKGNQFITSPGNPHTTLHVGAVLHVGSAGENPPGKYSGTENIILTITLMQE